MSDTGSEPTRCPCGFWGSPQTQNLCSKCYKDELRQKEKLEESKASLAGDTNSSSSSSAFPRPTASTGETSNEKGADEKTEGEKAEKGSTETTAVDNRDLPVDRPIQKSRKRCWTCKTKLELAQRELGACKCEYVFCQLHRLPEQHNCIFDHKESGRREARQKMVSPGPRKVGRSFQRMDE